MEHSLRDCAVCKSPVAPGLSSWHFICRACGYEGTDLKPAINEASNHEKLDESERETALRSLRKASFKIIVERAVSYLPRGRLLDVGSAHGWFLEEANQHYETLGLEPDQAVFARAAERGLHVRNGYFPDDLKADEQFDVIVFNDVIEHIPNIGQIIVAIHQRLTPSGILILNIPNSRGLFYRLSKLFWRLGVAGPFERMWQKGLPSPHLHYFNNENLESLVRDRQFDLLERFELPSVRSEGLLERIRFAGGQGKVSTYCQYLLIRALMPFLSLFQSDIIVAIFRKR